MAGQDPSPVRLLRQSRVSGKLDPDGQSPSPHHSADSPDTAPYAEQQQETRRQIYILLQNDTRAAFRNVGNLATPRLCLFAGQNFCIVVKLPPWLSALFFCGAITLGHGHGNALRSLNRSQQSNASKYDSAH
jgi:hypothetical protein